tara:strand:+ start:224 stop:592 length:369 start_codon:yes stop_codon:yes gene_type:complete
MANPQWPASLPDKVQASNYQERPPNRVLSSSMDVGPVKTRLRDTAAAVPLPVTMVMTSDQVDTFEQFFEDDILWGVLPFDATHPRKRTPITVLLAGEEKYTLTPIGGGADYWRVSMNWSIQP